MTYVIEVADRLLFDDVKSLLAASLVVIELNVEAIVVQQALDLCHRNLTLPIRPEVKGQEHWPKFLWRQKETNNSPSDTTNTSISSHYFNGKTMVINV